MLTYKGYIAHISFDDEADIFHGEVINTRDVVTFQGTTVSQLKKAFIDSVEDYLDFCKERNESPEKPFSGTFNARLGPSLHAQAYTFATLHDMSLNELLINSVKYYLQEHRNSLG